MNSATFELTLSAEGSAVPGRGILAAFAPPSAGYAGVVVAGGDPRHTTSHVIEDVAAPAFAHIYAAIERPTPLRWAIVDQWGRFFEAVPHWQGMAGRPLVRLRRFPGGNGIDAFAKELGTPGEDCLEMLSAVIEGSIELPPPTTEREFLEAITSHGRLPAPGTLFQRVAAAASTGDLAAAIGAIETEPAIAALLLDRSGAPAGAGSLADAAQSLGLGCVKRVVFIAEMMERYRQGACPAFDYTAYWQNALATGAAMRGLMRKFGIPERLADEGFATGLLAGIGWLAVAETFPSLMSRYLELARDATPIAKTRAQAQLFPCSIRQISAHYLARFGFAESIRSPIAGKPLEDGWNWFDCLASAIRVGQALSPFDCLPLPRAIPVPESCRAEWRRWRHFPAQFQ